jgi:hypothetical protein
MDIFLHNIKKKHNPVTMEGLFSPNVNTVLNVGTLFLMSLVLIFYFIALAEEESPKGDKSKSTHYTAAGDNLIKAVLTLAVACAALKFCQAYGKS